MSGKFTRVSVLLHNWMEDSSSRMKTMLPQKHHVEGSFAARILGKTLLREELWSLKGEALARGLALGIFIAFTPTIGIQMTLVCIFILLYPGNLPIALLATWLTNPVTAVPVYGTEWYVGKMILGLFGHHASAPPSFFEYESVTDIVHNIFKQGGALWFGSIISSAILAVTSYWGMMGFVYLERWLRKIKLDDLRRLRRALRLKKREEENNQPASELGAEIWPGGAKSAEEEVLLAPDDASTPTAQEQNLPRKIVNR